MRDAASLVDVLAEVASGKDWFVAALDYELGYLLEPRSAPPDWQPDGSALARFWRFADCEVLSAAQADAWLAGRSQGRPAGLLNVQPGISETDYLQAVTRIQGYISDGDCYQVNYTLPLHFNWFGSPAGLYQRLRARQPVSYGGFVETEEGGLVSLSPELFLEKTGHRLHTRPMKGTAPRATDPACLHASQKDRAENLMIVDLLRNDLGRIALNGSVKVEALFAIEDYPTVWQMVSSISAQLGEVSLTEILHALFPCGSITGAPKIRAMQIAGELEHAPRGRYTGALGWIAPGGDLRLNVAIRTLTLAADGKGCMGVGSGIVADSKGAAEWQECLLKARFLQAAAPDVQLIETLRREHGSYPALSDHWQRLSNSAAALGFPCDYTAFQAVLAQMPAEGCWRVRLTLVADGHLAAQAFPLLAEPTQGRLACLADERIDAEYLLRKHKTTDRALYDLALKQIAATPDVFDMVFLNQRGEVAEGARSNVFVERDGLLLTPPTSSGALPGVLRAQLLASGKAREAVLYPADLAQGFWLGNALRGLVPVRLDALVA